MPLIPCQECGQQISTLAAACPHCGAPCKAATVEEKKTGCGAWLALVLIVTIVLLVIAGVSSSSPSPTPSNPRAGKEVSVDIAVSSSALRLTNTGSADWTEAVVYLNGMPPFTFKHAGAAPAVGDSVTIDLNQFVDRDGTRFNPFAKAVTEVWVGGSGFDFAQRRVR